MVKCVVRLSRVTAFSVALAFAVVAHPSRASAQSPPPPMSLVSGPVASPTIIPIFWGNWSEEEDGNPADSPGMIVQWLKGFAGYLSGVNAPFGWEPVTKQYGVSGAAVYPYSYQFAMTGFDVDPNALIPQTDGSTVFAVQSPMYEVAYLNSLGFLPNSPNNIYLVFAKGWGTQYDLQALPAGTEAWHQNTQGVPYAVVPWEVTCGTSDPYAQCSNVENFQRLTAHELLEAATDPVPFNGYLTDASGLYPAEGGDPCQPQDSSTTVGAGDQNLYFGWVQTFVDNDLATCSTWTYPLTSHLSAVKTDTAVVDVFWASPAPQPQQSSGPGFVGHMWFTWAPNGTFEIFNEQIPANDDFVVSTPAAVWAAPGGGIDVFAHGVDGTNNQLHRATSTSAWSNTQMARNSIGQSSAVSFQANRIDVAMMNTDGSPEHLWSNDRITFGSETLSSQIMVPPVLALSPGAMDMFVLNSAGLLEGTRQPLGGGWSSFFGIPGGNLIPVAPAAVAQQVPDYSGEPVLENFAVLGASGGGTNPTQVWSPRLVATNSAGSWSNAQAFFDGAPFGAYSTITDPTNGDIYVAYQDEWPGGYHLQRFRKANHTWAQITSASNWDAVQDLSGVFSYPPAMVAAPSGSNGMNFIFGIALDDCLWYYQFSGSSAGTDLSGPEPTFVCSIQ
jgi:hypothetical protein